MKTKELKAKERLMQGRINAKVGELGQKGYNIESCGVSAQHDYYIIRIWKTALFNHDLETISNGFRLSSISCRGVFGLDFNALWSIILIDIE